MRQFRRLVILSLFIECAAAVAAQAQQSAPHLAYVLPAGGRQGTTSQVAVGGQFLSSVTYVHISGGGVQTAVLEYTRPMNAMQARQLRDRLQELQKQAKSDSVQREIADIRLKLLLFVNSRGTSPALAETVKLRIAIDPDAIPGRRELRLGTPQGLSNPLVFLVGSLPEFTEQESFSTPFQPGTDQQQMDRPPDAVRISLPATVNGRIRPGLARPPAQGRSSQLFTPGDADRYRFEARKNQLLTVVVSARELIPYLADAVPGWFQATVALYDSRGQQLAFEDDYRFSPDPVLHYRIPEDGEYEIEIRDALHRGREDFVYRITVGEIPFVTSIFPLGGRAGTRFEVRLAGWNLPLDKMKINAEDKAPGIYPLSEQSVSREPAFQVGTLPEVLEREPNDRRDQAVSIKLPVILNGRIDRPGDWDVFRFEGRSGERIVSEVYARRLGSPLDSVLRLTDSSGRQLAFNDDNEDKGAGLETHHADSLIVANLPTDGTYYLYLGDTQQKGGPEYGYRLRVSAPVPDFGLRVVPSSISIRVGTTVPITVYALRRDGFTGEIALLLKGAPEGFTLSGARIPANRDQIRLTLTVPPEPFREPVSLHLEGHATIQGREVVRRGVPAEDMTQAFSYRHLVPAQELTVAATGRGMPRLPVRILSDMPVKVPAGGTARLRIAVPPAWLAAQVQLELSDPPEGISMQTLSTSRAGVEIELQGDATILKPGLEGNLIVSASGVNPAASSRAKTPAGQRRLPLGSLPAIPFLVTEK